MADMASQDNITARSGMEAALQDLLNRVLDVLATMDDDADWKCPWCGHNPHWKQCDILPIVQYATLVLHAPRVQNKGGAS